MNIKVLYKKENNLLILGKTADGREKIKPNSNVKKQN